MGNWVKGPNQALYQQMGELEIQLHGSFQGAPFSYPLLYIFIVINYYHENINLKNSITVFSHFIGSCS